ncbi:hypothetical protein MFLO_07412 [Listeria floridensis FSL S10-1187]|uniref:Uncharacterized protein n=1 Tax=Listeria floridensis FSL S10-1187 TaxID=1265817 RepID=A0ABN0RFA1_9LIST|nr:hypothetical protein [Listeria floridensis]EUJ31999.1 hypothetical protein MFLO_07412 [Listeria floridensis FSL S10-1187]
MKRYLFPILAFIPAPFLYFYLEYAFATSATYPWFLVPLSVLYFALTGYFSKEYRVTSLLLWNLGSLGLSFLFAHFFLVNDSEYYQPFGEHFMIVYTWLLMIVAELFVRHVVKYYNENVRVKK